METCKEKDFRCCFTGDQGFIDNMKYLQNIEDVKNLKAIVVQDLKSIGVKAPKPKKCKNKEEQQVGVSSGVIWVRSKCNTISRCYTIILCISSTS